MTLTSELKPCCVFGSGTLLDVDKKTREAQSRTASKKASREQIDKATDLIMDRHGNALRRLGGSSEENPAG